ncbi:MAG: single-stranded-DNA-specific exonuclease RecJ [Synechococcus sp. NAT40]|nr:single-stranded-DNA-specific exonuclease RecJ [Synechococcus sp. NAT40]
MPTAVLPQLWQLPRPAGRNPLSGVALPIALRAVLARRGTETVESAEAWIQPPDLPPADGHFPDLKIALARLVIACEQQERVAICGDYDADGMTSTALLIRALQALQAQPIAAIPSRMDDGYGLNSRMVEELHADGVNLLVTVDNGVAAAEALCTARALGVEVIITDHHTIPDPPPQVLALVHPATTPEHSPYRGLAGVGLAFVLARCLAEALNQPDAITSARDLFCIGTIADMAPLTGANRVWLQEGLRSLHRTKCAGLKALQQLSGLEERPLRADDIGFQIAPRINAVGRLGEPRLVVDLLTEDNADTAVQLARQCDGLNRQRRELCDAIEAEAMALVEADAQPLPPFLLLAQGHWHHGVIGIVAARLMDHYQRPAALLAAEGNGLMRASVRAPEGFAVDQALHACAKHLERFGGHPAAGGFTVKPERVAALHEQLNDVAAEWMTSRHQGVVLQPEALLRFDQIDRGLWSSLQKLEPFGIGNPTPLFWARDCEVIDQRQLRGGHLRLRLRQGETLHDGIAWRWKGGASTPERIDLAFRLSLNRWQGEERLQLEIQAIRAHHPTIVLQRHGQEYQCEQVKPGTIVLANASGQKLVIDYRDDGLHQCDDNRASHPYVAALIEEAAIGLGLQP